MGRSRSREKDKKDRKDKDRKRSRSRERREKKRSRSREKKEKKEKKERDEPPPPAPPERKRSPSMQYRRWRFDSPPKEDEYRRDAMLTGNPMGLGGAGAAMAGGLPGGAVVSPLALAQDTKAMRELYVGNLPAGITAPQLVQFLNQVSQAVKVNSLPGEPVLGATMGGGGLFAFVEFRTAEEAANGLRLNGVELLGCQLKVGRPKGYTGPEPGAGGQLAIGAAPGAGGAPSLGEMMAANGALGRPGMMGLPGMAGAGGGPSAIDHRLCLVNIPSFVADERIKELLLTFGQLRFFAMQKDEDGKSVGVAFFEYNDMMTQQQARAALEGLELGRNKLSVKKPEEVLALGLVAKEQKLGARVVPCKVIYLKNIVTMEDLTDDGQYAEICADIRLEGEKFGTVISMEIPRPRGYNQTGPLDNALTDAARPGGGVMALEDTRPDGTPGAPAPKAAAVQAPAVPDLSMAIVPVGGGAKAPLVPTVGSQGAFAAMGALGGADTPGLTYAFLEFATIEGASKAKKAMSGRRFGPNLVEAEYFSENKYAAKDFNRPTPNTDEPSKDPGTMELALVGGGLEEAPVMVE